MAKTAVGYFPFKCGICNNDSEIAWNEIQAYVISRFIQQTGDSTVRYVDPRVMVEIKITVDHSKDVLSNSKICRLCANAIILECANDKVKL